MRLRMTAMALVLSGMAGPYAPAFSQSAPDTTTPNAAPPPPAREAPIGHRQPTASSVAGDNKLGMDRVQREQERINRIENKAMGSICSNCGTR